MRLLLPLTFLQLFFIHWPFLPHVLHASFRLILPHKCSLLKNVLFFFFIKLLLQFILIQCLPSFQTFLPPFSFSLIFSSLSYNSPSNQPCFCTTLLFQFFARCIILLSPFRAITHPLRALYPKSPPPPPPSPFPNSLSSLLSHFLSQDGFAYFPAPIITCRVCYPLPRTAGPSERKLVTDVMLTAEHVF
jgi:hypothetical protein